LKEEEEAIEQMISDEVTTKNPKKKAKMTEEN